MDAETLYSGVRLGSAPSPSAASGLLRRIEASPAAAKPGVSNKPVVLYGAGNLGKLARDFFRQVGQEIRVAVDAAPERHREGDLWRGIEILAPSEVAAERKAESLLAVCVVTAPYAPLHESLVKAGWRDVAPFYDVAQNFTDRHPLNNGWYSGPLSTDDLAGVDACLNGWSDDISRAHHLGFLAWHYSREEWSFENAPIDTTNRYFIPEVTASLRGDEVFLDVGAHHGEVSLRFLKLVGGSYHAIIAVEPDPANTERMLRELAASPLFDGKRFTMIENPVAETPATSKFCCGLDYASQLSGLGTRLMEVASIDQLSLSPTFLKLHIEGGELSALRGALKTIAEKRPIIAATAYHNRQGVCELPLWLMNNLRDYRFYYRLHGWCGTGSVVYAVPNERAGRPT